MSDTASPLAGLGFWDKQFLAGHPQQFEYMRGQQQQQQTLAALKQWFQGQQQPAGPPATSVLQPGQLDQTFNSVAGAFNPGASPVQPTPTALAPPPPPPSFGARANSALQAMPANAPLDTIAPILSAAFGSQFALPSLQSIKPGETPVLFNPQKGTAESLFGGDTGPAGANGPAAGFPSAPAPGAPFKSTKSGEVRAMDPNVLARQQAQGQNTEWVPASPLPSQSTLDQTVKMLTDNGTPKDAALAIATGAGKWDTDPVTKQPIWRVPPGFGGTKSATAAPALPTQNPNGTPAGLVGNEPMLKTVTDAFGTGVALNDYIAKRLPGFKTPTPETMATTVATSLRPDLEGVFRGADGRLAPEDQASINEVLPAKINDPAVAYDKLAAISQMAAQKAASDAKIANDQAQAPEIRQAAQARIISANRVVQAIGNPKQFARPGAGGGKKVQIPSDAVKGADGIYRSPSYPGKAWR